MAHVLITHLGRKRSLATGNATLTDIQICKTCLDRTAFQQQSSIIMQKAGRRVGIVDARLRLIMEDVSVR
jgi:hypothetical protein